jgi:tRNA-dihydrouridine synthase
MQRALGFYGERLGLRMFKKHLGWYVEAAPWPDSRDARRQAKSRLCRLDSAAEVERELSALWFSDPKRAAA